MRVVIVGGGVGGLALAIELQNRGVEIELVEQADEFSEVGAGVFLMANAVKALQHLGVDVAPSSNRSELMAFCDFESDDLLYTTDFDVAGKRYGADAYFVHRADLLDALLEKVDPTTVHVGSKVVGIEQGDREATAELADGRRISGDAIVGADGLKSTVRSLIFEPTEPEFSEIVAWRSIFPFERIADLGLEPNTQHLWLGPKRSVVAYPLRQDELYNFVGMVPATEVTSQSWSQTGEVEDLRASFEGGCGRLASIIEAIDAAFVVGLYYRAPLKAWGVGRVGLTGDAAHPALPTAGQGAAMALEDAVILGSCLAERGPDRVADAIDEFATRRRLRTGRVLGLSRANAEMLTFDTPELSRARNGRWRGMQTLDPEGNDLWHWLWSYDIDAEVEEIKEGPNPANTGNKGGAQGIVADETLWAGVLTPADRSRGWVGERQAYDRFWDQQSSIDGADEIREVSVGEVPGLMVGSKSQQGTVAVHLHGGGFTVGSARSSAEFAKRLAQAVDGSTLVPEYRLAPEVPFPGALEDAIAACQWAVDKFGAGNVLLSGEGAGASLALGAAVSLRDEGRPLPRGIYLVSPLCDLSLSGESIDLALGTDLWNTRETLTIASASYLQGDDPKEPRCSPLFADLSGLSPMLIQAGKHEALVDDAKRLAANARAQGVQATLQLYEHGLHSFVLFPSVVSSREGLRDFRMWFNETGDVAGDKIESGRR